MAASGVGCYGSAVAEIDREYWNGRYAEATALSPPSRFLVGLDAVLPRRGRALDLAGGTGRHALWLAGRGLDVSLADVSDVAVAAATHHARAAGLGLQPLRIDLQRGVPAGPWDVIACFYYLDRTLYRSLPGALAPGGWLVVAHSTRTNQLRHARPGPAHLLEDGELPTLFRELEIVSFTEGWCEEGRHEARLVGRRR
jgi:SAM-dependent methyltransferase